MNEKAFESRRVRTHPWTRISEMAAELFSAVLTGVGDSMPRLCRAIGYEQGPLSSARESNRRPLFRLEISCDQPGALVEREIRPGPLKHHGKAIAETDQEND